jgi:uncharacterized protein (TIGR03437 family)
MGAVQKLSPVLFVSFCVFGTLAGAQPVVNGVSNAASYQQAFSPGSLVAIFGSNFGSNPAVTVAGKSGFVISNLSTANQLTAQLPVDAPLGPTTLTVSSGGQTSAAVSLTIAAYAPAFFSQDGSGTGLGAFVHASGALVSVGNPANPGETLIGIAIGLGQTSPPLVTGVTPTGNPQTTAKVTTTLGGDSRDALFAGAIATGEYQVNFVVPNDASGCHTDVVLNVGGVSSPPLNVPIATSQPVICAAEHSATGAVRDAAHPGAANSFLSIYVAAPALSANGTNLFPSTDYFGVGVSFNGAALPLYSVTTIPPSQILINTIIPSEAGSSGTGTLAVRTSKGASLTYTIGLTQADVGVFRLPDPHVPTRIQGVALVANTYWFAMPSSLAASYGLKACTGLPAASPCGQPAKPGDSLVIYFTGGGLATPNADAGGKPVPTGSVAPADGSVIYQTVVKPTITIGGVAAPVLFSGIAPGTASEYQINTTIPLSTITSDDVPVVITFGSSSDTFTIAVKGQ